MESANPGEDRSGQGVAGAHTARRIDSVAFARKREAQRGALELSAMSRLLDAGVAPRGSIEWQLEGWVAPDDLERLREFLRVRTRFSPWVTCSRCLEPVQLQDLETDTRFRLAASENQAARENGESGEIVVVAADPNLDLAALVEDEAILALPMAPVHPDCDWAARLPQQQTLTPSRDVY